MATANKTSKPARTAAAAAPKAAARAEVKTKAAPAKPAKSSIKKSAGLKKEAALTKAAAAPRKQPAKKAAGPAKPPISTEQRRHYIEVAAYFIAERTGFSASSALDHWTQAEAEIDRLLSEGKLNT